MMMKGVVGYDNRRKQVVHKGQEVGSLIRQSKSPY